MVVVVLVVVWVVDVGGGCGGCGDSYGGSCDEGFADSSCGSCGRDVDKGGVYNDVVFFCRKNLMLGVNNDEDANDDGGYDDNHDEVDDAADTICSSRAHDKGQLG